MKRLPLLLAAACLLPLSACSTSDAGDDGVRVVTTLYPLEYVASRIAGDQATVTNLVPPGREPHELELSIPKTAELADADLVIYVKGFQPAVDDAVAENGPEHVVDAAETIDLRPDDPHFWLDPTRLSDVAAAVERSLAEVAPDQAAGFANRLAALQQELDTLDREYRQGLADCRLTTVVVTHDAFGYLAKYGLDFAPVVGLTPEAEPSPEHLADLHRLVEEKGVTTVFTEPLASAKVADTLAEDLGIRTAVLDPIEGLSDETAGADYLTLMRQNLKALKEANRCR